jgi:ABC-type branched-subunit amino acid transport system ATPase component
VDGVYAGYRGLDILQGVSLRVGRGQVVTIIGPNGAGKSTLAKVICGLVRPRRGRVRFRGEDVAGAKPSEIVRRGLGFVPQERNVFPNLTVWENLLLGGHLLPGGMDARVRRLFDMFPILREKRHQKAGLLSGGQRQMLAMARALMLEPEMLVLDEPSAGLAPNVVEAVFERIREINRQGCTVLMVEQNARLALAMSDWGYVLDMGRNALDAAGPSLLEDPRVVELYLGSLGSREG